ncbi:hypothetical protein Bca52824_087850 [Brassica carinata]|uniref:Protein transport protein SEC23 n=1 Tax=Brassica carinata TaxID=52824 RepID=A0A8X7TNC1_BRACI|nr:hypothetical protein Bca52824_087850 [Brassica carinata]
MFLKFVMEAFEQLYFKENIVSKDLIEPLRSHKDLDKGEAPFYEKAEKFYHGLANQLVNQGHVLDIFASVLDQVGVAETKATVERTGGLVVISESFGHSVFKDSFKRVFEDVNNLSKGPTVADIVIGEGNTTEWKMCGLDKISYEATTGAASVTLLLSQGSPPPSSSSSSSMRDRHVSTLALAYSTPSHFSADVRLTFSNAMTYNPPANPVYLMADSFLKSGGKLLTRTSLPEEPYYLNLLTTNCLTMTPLLNRLIINFLRDHISNAGGSGDDEIEIDINDLSHDALFQLRDLLDEFLQETQNKYSNGDELEGVKWRTRMLTLFITSNLNPASLLSGHTRMRQWGTPLLRATYTPSLIVNILCLREECAKTIEFTKADTGASMRGIGVAFYMERQAIPQGENGELEDASNEKQTCVAGKIVVEMGIVLIRMRGKYLQKSFTGLLY